MSSYSLLTRRAIRDRQQTAYPRYLLRALIEELQVGPGARLLMAGAVTKPLTAFFLGLGIDVASLSALPAEYGEYPRMSSGIAGTGAHQLDRFDAALIAGTAYGTSLFEFSALRKTANLLTMVRGGGRLVVLSPDLDETSRGLHSESCFAGHLRFFHGKVDFRRYPGRLRRRLPSFESETAHCWTCTLSLTSEPRLPRDWWACADRAAAANLPPCCAKARAAVTPIAGEAA